MPKSLRTQYHWDDQDNTSYVHMPNYNFPGNPPESYGEVTTRGAAFHSTVSHYGGYGMYGLPATTPDDLQAEDHVVGTFKTKHRAKVASEAMSNRLWHGTNPRTGRRA